MIVLSDNGVLLHNCHVTSKRSVHRLSSLFQDLNMHEIKMKGERSHKCTQCAKLVLTASDLRKPMLTHGEKTHKCDFCSYSATTGPYLKRHMNIHTREKQFTCTECDKSFSESGSLNIHKRIHTGEKPYKCTLCKYTSAVAGNLKQHILRHTSEKPTFACKSCSKSFKSENSLKYHIVHNHTDA